MQKRQGGFPGACNNYGRNLFRWLTTFLGWPVKVKRGILLFTWLDKKTDVSHCFLCKKQFCTLVKIVFDELENSTALQSLL